jgi:ubiquinone/menaquinone biosynthesis C-methylase UbiE
MAALTPQEKAEKTYNSTADFFDDPALGFWDRAGRRTVELLDLQAGMRVLDVCCGTGASALPGARAVGSEGKVIGVDLAEGLLELARKKAAALGLDQIEFVKGDMTALPFEEGSFDAVIIVFGIFFVPDMEDQVRKLWRLVRPGGKLGVTTWGPRFFEPAYTEWKAVLTAMAPGLVGDFSPWDRITSVEAVQRFIALDGSEVKVFAEDSVQLLEGPEDFWKVAMGSGLRWPIEKLGPDKAMELKGRLLERLTSLTGIETNVIYGVAMKTRG